MSRTDEIKERADRALLHTYNRYPVVLDHGNGMHLYDVEGKEYLDFFAGIAVNGLGEHYPSVDAAMKNQIDKIMHTSNYYYNEPALTAAEKLKEISGMDRVFFTNSGTEAVEGAVKMAIRYAYDKDHRHDHEIIAMKNSFHGRSIGALSVTGNDAYREPFKPLLPGIRFADLNEIDSVKALVNDRTCAVIVEPIQGEGGIYPATEEFMKELRALCDENDLLLIADEIQCGLGRTGQMFYYQTLGVTPDIVTVAKALGNGVPIGAFMSKEYCAALKPGDHGTTYGGNPFAASAACAVLLALQNDGILENVRKTGAYLYERLEELKKENPHITDHRGVGLMQGLEFDEPVGEIILRAQENGLLLISAGSFVLRFLPPLIAAPSDVDEMMEKLTASL